VPAAKVSAVLERARAASVLVSKIGTTDGDTLALRGERALPVAKLRETFEAWLPDYMVGEVTNA
jgi:phosphoribosylformylglycinamidine synthase subunit PurL